MKTILHLSDFHAEWDSFQYMLDFQLSDEHRKPDLILITGDMVVNFRPSLKDLGNEDVLQSQHYERMIEHLGDRYPRSDIIAVRGNHDWCNYAHPEVFHAFDGLGVDTITWNEYEVSGFRGVLTHQGYWKDEFSERQLDAICSGVPIDTQILVTHVPPYGILDDRNNLDNAPPRHIGSVAVRDLVDRLPHLKLHVFGHCHEQGGGVRTQLAWTPIEGEQEMCTRLFSNAAGECNWIELE